MSKLLPLPILLLIAFTLHAKTLYHTGSSSYSLNWSAIPRSDSIPTPAPKVSLLKKLAKLLQFGKNAKAKEQARVLNIIARSGLKDSLHATIRMLDSISAVNHVTDTLQQHSIKEVLREIDSLTASLAKIDSIVGAGGTDDSDNTSTAANIPPDDQEIQDLVNKVITPVDPQQLANLQLIRKILQQKAPITDRVTVNDTLSRYDTFRISTRVKIIGFFPSAEGQPNRLPDLRLIDELAWSAVKFDGATGELTDFNGWDTSPVIDSARARGCRISLCILSKNTANTLALLKDTAARKKLIDRILNALKIRRAAGVQIQFDSLPRSAGASFTAFIIKLAQALKAPDISYQLSIRIPANDREDGYDLGSLKEYASRFFIDFTQYQPAIPGPLAPLAGVHNNDLSACISRYVNKNIPSSQIFACLPYRGIIWDLKPDQRTYKNDPKYITYKDIRSIPDYQQSAVYESVSATERLDIRNKSNTRLIERIWYDDQTTLTAKYNFIRQNQLGGVAIQTLGDDNGYGELWDALASQLAKIDTSSAYVKATPHKTKVLDDWQWSSAYIGAKLEQFGFILSYPCETEFPKVLTKKWGRAGVKNNDREQVRQEEAALLGILSLIFMTIFIAGLLLFISKIRSVGDGWKWTKLLAAGLTLFFTLLTITGFTYLFLDTSIIYFGVSKNAADCFDFPFGTLFLTIFFGIAIGFLVTRFFVFRLIEKADIP